MLKFAFALKAGDQIITNCIKRVCNVTSIVRVRKEVIQYVLDLICMKAWGFILMVNLRSCYIPDSSDCRSAGIILYRG